jgi:hypothetical protein
MMGGCIFVIENRNEDITNDTITAAAIISICCHVEKYDLGEQYD